MLLDCGAPVETAATSHSPSSIWIHASKATMVDDDIVVFCNCNFPGLFRHIVPEVVVVGVYINEGFPVIYM